MKRTLCCLAVIASAFASANASANGRFPNAQQLREPAPGSLVVAATYGLLVSGNSGQDFQFVCESALFGKALMGSWADPLLETLPDGTIISGSQNGLRVSRDRGCSFRTEFELPHDASLVTPGQDPVAPQGTVIDVCPAYDSANSVLALTTLHADDGSIIEHRIYKSSDGARSFAPLAMPLEKSQIAVVLTLDAAPSDPLRIYVSGTSAGQSVLAVSSDGGNSYSLHSIAIDDPDGVTGAYIAAVSPTDPNRLYLRVSRKGLDDAGSDTWDDSLLVSDDAGAHFHDVLRRRAALLGFALSPDGTQVLAGFGDPMIPPVITSEDALGIYAATSDTLAFSQRVPNLAVSCLRWTSTALYACAKENNPLATGGIDFHIGAVKPAAVPDNLQAFEPLLKLRDVRGPLPREDGTPSACAEEWKSTDPNTPAPSTCSALNACASTGSLSAGAIRCGSAGMLGSGGTTTAAGGSATNGTGGTSNGTGASATHAAGGRATNAEGGRLNNSAGAGGTSLGPSGGAANEAESAGKSGCGCRIERSAGAPRYSVFPLAAVAYLVRRRKPRSA